MSGYSQLAGDILEQVRAKAPRVHCLTNGVALNLTANMLLAVGAIPSVTDDIREVYDFVKSADALLVNLGQLSEVREGAIHAAISASFEAQIPWVLDPVFIHRSSLRTEFARGLLALSPALVRGNAAEWGVLKNPSPIMGEGASEQHEETDEGEKINRFNDSPSPVGFADTLSHYGRGEMVRALSAPIDEIQCQDQTVHIHNGHPYMARVTAMGCAGTAVMAACLAAHEDAFEATIAGFVILGVAGEMAAENAQGVGTFQPVFLDALGQLTPEILVQRGRVK